MYKHSTLRVSITAIVRRSLKPNRVGSAPTPAAKPLVYKFVISEGNKMENKMNNKKYYKKLDKIIEKETKRIKKERKYYKKKYGNKDTDPMVCGPLQFIWGINSINHNEEASFNSWNDIDVSYNRDTGKYILHVETALEFLNLDHQLKYYTDLLKQFKKFINANDFETKEEYSPYDVFNTDLFVTDTIPALYFGFKLLVDGYKVYLKEKSKSKKIN